MGKTSFAEKIKGLFKGNTQSEDFFEDLTDSLIEGDIGARTAFEITEILEEKCKKNHISDEEGIKNVIVAGGVAANNGLRTAMQQLSEELNVELSIPPMKYCTDNATMIAAAGYYAYLDGRRADLTLNSKSQDTLC